MVINRPAPTYTLWRLYKGDSMAEATIASIGEQREWQLKVDGQVVIGCGFQSGNGDDQVNALARTAHAELQSRGWTPNRAR